MNKTLDKQSRTWLIISIALSVALVMVYCIISAVYNGTEDHKQIIMAAYKVAVAISALAVAVLAVACFKIKGLKKMVPIVGVMVSLGIATLSWFAVWFSGYVF